MSEEIGLFLGHGVSYWLELERKAKELNVVGLIKEIVKLRGKVSFYEAWIHEMNTLMASDKKGIDF